MRYGHNLHPQTLAMLQYLVANKDASTAVGTQAHGPGGLLATPGLNRQIVNAMILPEGLAGRLPVRPNTSTNEIVPILTGLTATTGTRPTVDCGDWPTVGEFKTCAQTFTFGYQGLRSKPLNIARAGEIVNRGEFTDNTLFGAPDPGDNTPVGQINWQRAFQLEHEKKMAELWTGYYRDYAPLIWRGNKQNTGTTGYVEYDGLDRQINTGKRDAITGARCEAADSVVFDFNGLNINTSGAQAYAYIANVVTNLERLSRQLKIQTEWALTMTYGAFWTLTNVWPCVYATAGCGVNTIVRTQSINEATDMRDEMRQGSYLLIEGRRYEVIIDDSIAETVVGSGTYQSNIYLVPMRGNGQPLTFWEFFPFPQVGAAAAAMAPANYFTTTQNGRFLIVRLTPTSTCVQVEVQERPRLILYAPHLAARFNNLRYTITVHERTSFPGDPYFVNGGSTTTPLPYFYPNGGV